MNSQGPFTIKQVGRVSGGEVNGQEETVREYDGGRRKEGNSPSHNSHVSVRGVVNLGITPQRAKVNERRLKPGRTNITEAV